MRSVGVCTYKRCVAIIIILSIVIINIGGCASKNEIKQGVAVIQDDVIREKYIEEETIPESMIEETGIAETVLEDNGKYETKIGENIISESYVFEVKISDDDDVLYEQLPQEIFEYEIDWENVLSNFTVGATVVLVCGTLTVSAMGTPLYYFFATSMAEISKEMLVGSVIGALSNTALSGIRNGSINQVAAQKYAIEGASSGMMWGAISGVASVVAKAITRELPTVLFDKSNRPLWYVDELGNTYDADGTFIGHLTQKEENYVINNMGLVLGNYDDAGHVIDDIKKVYPSNLRKIQKNGRYSFNFKVSDGTVIYGNKEIGRLNEAGDIIGTGIYEGEKIGSIDATGKLVENNLRAIKSGVKFNGYGEIQNMYKNAAEIRLKGDALRFKDYLNDSGEVVAYSVKALDHKGTERLFLMGAEDNTVIGIMKDDTMILQDWNSEISKLAADGVRTARGMTESLIEENINYDFGPSMTGDILEGIRTTKEFPDSLLQGHHKNNVANYPWLADNPDNIIFYNRADHLAIGHNGNFQNASSGELTDLEEVYNSVRH